MSGSQPSAPRPFGASPPAQPPAAALGETASDWHGLFLAAATLILVLIVCYMAVRVYKALRPPPPCGYPGEGFAGGEYLPSCSSKWMSARRGACKGLTSGDMPSIDEDIPISWAPCCGTLGVPPPTSY